MYILDQLKGIDSTLIEVGRFQKTGIEHPSLLREPDSVYNWDIWVSSRK